MIWASSTLLMLPIYNLGIVYDLYDFGEPE
jgi:hypothetical protein